MEKNQNHTGYHMSLPVDVITTFLTDYIHLVLLSVMKMRSILSRSVPEQTLNIKLFYPLMNLTCALSIFAFVLRATLGGYVVLMTMQIFGY